MITDDDKRKIVELRRKNFSLAKIAKELNLSLSTVYRHSSSSNQDLVCPHCGMIIFNGKIFLDKIKKKNFNSIRSDADIERLKKEREEISKLLANTIIY